ncbi:hypothetical protein CR513_41804, partial [Mucuna pruriens]
MPAWSKLDFCQFAAGWAGAHCPCRTEFDAQIEDFHLDLDPDLEGKGERIPLPWEILQPALRILGHCLLGPLNSQDVKDAASFAVRCLYARASHDLAPQAILATRSLIQLDVRTREAARANAASSNANTPTKVKKPEILLGNIRRELTPFTMMGSMQSVTSLNNLMHMRQQVKDWSEGHFRVYSMLEDAVSVLRVVNSGWSGCHRGGDALPFYFSGHHSFAVNIPNITIAYGCRLPT